MKKIILILLSLSILSVTIFGQDDLSKDRDYQNFTRNYKRALKFYEQTKVDRTSRNENSAKRYAKYSRKFLDKLIVKYGQERFINENKKIKEIESYFQKNDSRASSMKKDFEYTQLWMFRLKPESLNSFNATTYLKDFDKSKLLKAYENAKNYDEFKRRITPTDIKNFEMALNDFENYLSVIKVFDKEKGMIGLQLENSKRIQDKDYFVQTLSIARDIANALLIVSPTSKSLLAKKQELNNLISNADAQIKKNKPKLVKKYKDFLPKAVARNRNLERQFVDAIKYQKYPGVTITGAIITSSNWVMQKSVDGRSLYRKRDGVVTARTKEGDCWFQNYTFKQPYTGSGFGKAMRSSTGERFYIKCSKIK